VLDDCCNVFMKVLFLWAVLCFALIHICSVSNTAPAISIGLRNDLWGIPKYRRKIAIKWQCSVCVIIIVKQLFKFNLNLALPIVSQCPYDILFCSYSLCFTMLHL